MNTKEILLINNIVDEIESTGAWYGHMSAIDYLEDYYRPFLKLLEKYGIPSKGLELLHDKALEEEGTVDNWMNDVAIETFEELDNEYFNEFTRLCHEAVEKLNIEI